MARTSFLWLISPTIHKVRNCFFNLNVPAAQWFVDPVPAGTHSLYSIHVQIKLNLTSTYLFTEAGNGLVRSEDGECLLRLYLDLTPQSAAVSLAL